MAGQNSGELAGGKFPKEPDEGDEEVIEHNLAQQRAKQGQHAGNEDAAAKPRQDRGDAGPNRDVETDGSLSDEQKRQAIDSTKGLP